MFEQKAAVQFDECSGFVRVYLYDRETERSRFITEPISIDEKGLLTVRTREINRGEYYPDLIPYLQCSAGTAFNIAEAIIKSLKTRGFEQKSESFTAGELKATKEHLEDLRKIVFKGKQ